MGTRIDSPHLMHPAYTAARQALLAAVANLRHCELEPGDGATYLYLELPPGLPALDLSIGPDGNAQIRVRH